MEPEEVQKVFNEANMDKTEVMTTKRLTLGFQNFLSNHLIVSLSECPSVIFEAGRLSIYVLIVQILANAKFGKIREDFILKISCWMMQNFSSFYLFTNVR